MSQVPQQLCDLIAKYRRRATPEELNREHLDGCGTASIDVVDAELELLIQEAGIPGQYLRFLRLDLKALRHEHACLQRTRLSDQLVEVAMDLATSEKILVSV